MILYGKSAVTRVGISPIAGYGLFAAESIKKDAFIIGEADVGHAVLPIHQSLMANRVCRRGNRRCGVSPQSVSPFRVAVTTLLIVPGRSIIAVGIQMR